MITTLRKIICFMIHLFVSNTCCGQTAIVIAFAVVLSFCKCEKMIFVIFCPPVGNTWPTSYPAWYRLFITILIILTVYLLPSFLIIINRHFHHHLYLEEHFYLFLFSHFCKKLTRLSTLCIPVHIIYTVYRPTLV